MNEMKKVLILMASAAIIFSCATNRVPQLGRQSVSKVVAAMTLEEKVKMLIGSGMAGFSGDSTVVGQTQSLVPGAAGTTYPIPRLGIPAIVLADGPAGLRIQPVRKDDPATYYATAFPVGTSLASSWNTALVESVGPAIGDEVRDYGVDGLLAPALNIHRNPLCGRNFEYYSEDPVIAGKIASAMTRGVQSNGVGVSLKHFAANNQETNRMAGDSRVTPRALREIYLKGFEIAVKESRPWTIMSSYNYVNGVYTSESRELLTTVLRDEWGFDGVVMTDWFGGKDTPAQVHAGNDLLMPGLPKQYEAIVAAVNDGSLAIEDVDTNVARILELVVASPRFKGYEFSNKPDLAAHAQAARQSATEGMVLLENNGALPLAASVRNIAAFGITSYDFIAGGTGSGDVNEAYTVSLKDGLANAGYGFNADLAAAYENHIAAENEKNKPDPKNPYAAFMPKIRASEIVPAEADIARYAAGSDIALITIGRNSGEFADRRLEDGDFTLTGIERRLIESVCKAYHAAGKQVVVVLNIGGVIETASWKNLPDAILLAWQAGQEGGNSVADVLKGAVNPSGKLPMTFPVDYMDAASSANFPYDYVAGAPVFFPTGETKTELVKNIDYTNYEEDIYVGYRWFDTFGKEVSYPFGYGLSYTTFEYSGAGVSKAGGVFTVSVEVKNTGAVAGKEVVQLYAVAPASALGKPAQELKAFAKTKELKPGESQTLTMTVAESDLASYDEARSAWIVDAGSYEFRLSSSSRDVKSTLAAVVERASEVKTNDVLKLRETVSVLKP
jgi:beta-glucosidase